MLRGMISLKACFPLEELTVRRDRFEISLEYHNVSAYPSSMISPGIMGPFFWLPFMECIHGLISKDEGFF